MVSLEPRARLAQRGAPIIQKEKTGLTSSERRHSLLHALRSFCPSFECSGRELSFAERHLLWRKLYIYCRFLNLFFPTDIVRPLLSFRLGARGPVPEPQNWSELTECEPLDAARAPSTKDVFAVQIVLSLGGERPQDTSPELWYDLLSSVLFVFEELETSGSEDMPTPDAVFASMALRLPLSLTKRPNVERAYAVLNEYGLLRRSESAKR